MSVFLKNVTFHGILLDAFFIHSNHENVEWLELRDMFEEGVRQGVVVPLPETVGSVYDQS
jgi:fatty acid synthase